MKKHTNLYKLFSFAVVLCMVLSGLVILMPNINTITDIIPETAQIARAGDPLPPGDGTLVQDGIAGSGSDVLLINTYMYYSANPVGYNGGPDSYSIATKNAVDDIHANGYTVDAWYMSYYTAGYSNQRRVRGLRDAANWYNSYFPVDSNDLAGCIDSYDDYKAVIIIGYGYYCFGYNYGGSYETARPVTAERAMTGLEDYAANGGSIFYACYYSGYAPFYYQYYMGATAVQQAMVPRMRDLFDVTTGGAYRRNRNLANGYYTSYGLKGVEGETPNTGDQSIGIAHQDWPDYGYSEGDKLAFWYHSQASTPASYPSKGYDRFYDQHPTYNTYMDYLYTYYLQYPVGDGIIAMEGSGVSYTQIRMDYGWRSDAGRNPNSGTVQSDHGGDYKTVTMFCNPWMGGGTYRTTSLIYKYRSYLGPWASQPLMGSVLNYLVGGGPEVEVDVAEVTVTEIDSTGSDGEQIELNNVVSNAVNLYNWSITTESGSRKPSSYFGDYEDLSSFGVPGVLDDQTYFLNADDLYIDNYYAFGTDNFYLYKVRAGNDYGKYYVIYETTLIWWDDNDKVFLNETEKDMKSLGYNKEYVYQVELPVDWFFRHQYVALDQGDDHKHENSQDLSSVMPTGNYLDFDWESLVDGNVTTPNDETQQLSDYWNESADHTRLRYATLEDLYVTSDLDITETYLALYDDRSGIQIRSINMPTSPWFWKISTLPYEGIMFVNDNHPDTMFYYSHYTGGQAGGSGAYIEEIDITNDTYFTHYANEPYFQDTERTYGSTNVNFTLANAKSQITTVTLTAPILTDSINVNKNTGAIRTNPGANTIEISLDLMEDDYSWLFPRGQTYRDYTRNNAPTMGTSPLIVVTDEFSDIDQNKNELVANGQLSVWSHQHKKYIGAPIGWGTNGAAPEPAADMTAQAYFDGSRYKFGSYWTLGKESIGSDNNVPATAYGSVDVVINEVNPAYVELYNRGGSTVSMSGWTITGEGDYYDMSGSIAPGGFMSITESVFYIPHTPITGGRVSLFDDLGVLVSSIGYQTDVDGNQQSYCARHLDGIGEDYRYNDTMGQPWANGDPEAQENADWDHNVDRTPNSENYKDLTFLQIGTVVKESPWSLAENLSNYNADWSEGTLGVKKMDSIYINNFDVVFSLASPSTSNQWILDNYVMDGGRLYVEAGNWATLENTDFYNTIGISATAATGPATALNGAEPLTGGMQMGYTGNFASKFILNSESFTVWEDGGNVLAVLTVDIDTQNSDNSYRVVSSAVQYKNMWEMTRGDMPYDFTGRIVDYFLMSDDDVNHQPVIELKDPLADPEIPLFKSLPTLLWQNQDIDVWDKVAGTMQYTLYISTNRNEVVNIDPDAQSAVFVQETATATRVDAIDAPVAGIYYWGIFAEDKYEKTTYEYGGVFKFDSEVPSVNSMTAGNMETGVWDDQLPIGVTRVFGPGYQNSQGETVGRPDIFALAMSDNFGLKFSNNHISATPLYNDEYLQPPTAFSVDVFYFYGGQYEDDLPNFNLYVDDMGTNADLESLNGMPAVTFYMIPDGLIPDGQYHFYLQAADEVRWGSYMDWTFEVDLSAPDQPVDLMIDPATYIDQFDELFLKAGETYTLSITAPSSSDDGSMNRVEFQQAVADFPGATWETIGTDYDVSDNTYSVLWTPDTEHFYLRAIAYDYVENFIESEVSTSFHVDGVGPEAPLTLQADLDLTHTPMATVTGYVFDTIVEGQTSGIAYVVLWHYDSASGLTELVTDDQGAVIQVPVNDLSFEYDVDLDSITGASGDKAYSFYAQAIDNVGNEGEISEMATWKNTGEMESLRVISPSSIKDVAMGIDMEGTDDSLDEVRSIIVTFLSADQDFMNYMFTIRGETLRTSSDASAMGLPQGTKFLYNCFNVEVPPEFTNFEAPVTIEFHISSRSQLGTSTTEILENIRLVTKHSGESRFEVLEMIGGQPQVVDEDKGLYRVQARVNRFSDFAVIVAQTDVTVSDIILGANPAISGQEMSITVTVHNGGDFPKDAENVVVKVFAIDADGDQEFIGELDYGTIDAERDYYPSDAALKKGHRQETLYWSTSTLLADGEVQKFTIRAQVDPDGYVREISETNNEKTTVVEVVGSAQSSPSFALTFMLMALGVMVVSGMSVYARKKD